MHLWGGVVEQFFIPGFLILLLFQITYIFVQYYFHGYKEYSYYLGYIFCLMLYFLLRLESVIRFFDLFSISVINIKHMRNVLLLAPFIYYFKFSRHFLRMPEFYPNKNRQIKIIEDAVIVSIGGYILLMFLRIDQLMMYVLLVTLILFLLVIRYFIYFIRQKNNLTYFLLFGSLFAATGHIIAMIFSAYTNSANFFLFPPILATLIGLGLEILMFNLGLAAKAKADHENIIQSQQDLIEQYRQNEELRKSFHENRDRIARDLHDEIGSSLSSIRIYSTLALQRLNENPEEAKNLIFQINNNTGDVMEHMNDIVWSINPKNDTLEKIMERIKNYSTEVLSTQNIQFGIHYDQSLNDQQIPMETRQHLFLILKEAINNQAKHSNATRVNIELLLADSEMILKISDNGTGFDTTKTSKGNGLHNISSRVWDCGGSVDIVSEHQKGTQINIQIPLPNIRD
jgi:signal transduction histidine kinase